MGYNLRMRPIKRLSGSVPIKPCKLHSEYGNRLISVKIETSFPRRIVLCPVYIDIGLYNKNYFINC